MRRGIRCTDNNYEKLQITSTWTEVIAIGYKEVYEAFLVLKEVSHCLDMVYEREGIRFHIEQWEEWYSIITEYSKARRSNQVGEQKIWV